MAGDGPGLSMCGIGGILMKHGPVDRDLLGRMAETLIHRGPDDRGTHLDGPLGLFQMRLAIIVLAHGHLPMVDAPLTRAATCHQAARQRQPCPT